MHFYCEKVRVRGPESGPERLIYPMKMYKDAVLSQREPRDAAVIFFGNPPVFHPNFGGVSDRADRGCWGQPVKVISRDIIFKVFQPM